VTMATQHLEERRDMVRAVMPRVTRVFGQEVTRRAGEVNRGASGFGREIDVLAAPARAVLPGAIRVLGREVGRRLDYCNDSKLTYLFHLHS